jgi:hypothetical protein
LLPETPAWYNIGAMPTLQKISSKEWRLSVLRSFEIYMGFIVLLVVLLYVVFSIPFLISLDWMEPDTFFTALKRILSLIIGIEVARLLFAYNSGIILEIVAFLLVRLLITMEISERYDQLFIILSGITVMVILKMIYSTVVQKQNHKDEFM